LKKILAIDAGGSSLKYGVYNECGREVHKGGQAEIVRDDTTLVMQAFESIIEGYQDLDGIGLSLPGIFRPDTDLFADGGALYKLLEVNHLPAVMEEKYGIPVSLENDANCAALAEHWLGNGRGCKNLICITIGTGIGGGIIINNALHRGSHGRSGEFHWLLVAPDSDDVFGITATESLVIQAKKTTPLKVANGKDFFNNISHPDIQLIYRRWVTNFAWGLYNLATIFDPDKILIGGGISAQKRIYDDLECEIIRILPVFGEISYVREWAIEPCYFRNDAGKIGAVYKLLTTRFGLGG